MFAGFDVIWQLGRIISIGAGGIRAVYYLGGALLVVAGALGFLGPGAIRSQPPRQ